jgi:hypothetical protein
LVSILRPGRVFLIFKAKYYLPLPLPKAANEASALAERKAPGHFLFYLLPPPIDATATAADTGSALGSKITNG